MSIIVIRNGIATRVPVAEFALESTMQTQIAANPSILPLHEIGAGAELVAVVRELSVSAGYIDLLGFDAEGEVYVIETKLARNPDRRTVVAQALDYGAALWTGYAEPAAFFSAIDELLARAGSPRLLDAMRSAHGDDEAAAARTLERISQNLGNGAFRFVIPMDRIGEGLKDLVRYINENSRFTVYLVELEQYQDGDLTVVVPRLFGAEARKTVSGGAGGGRGTAGSATEFVEDLERRVAAGELDAREAEAVRGMLRIITDEVARHNWVTAPTGGRVNVSPRFPATGATKSPFTLRSDGRLMLNLGYVGEVPAWREWISNVLSTVGRSGDTRQFPELRSPEWAPHARTILGLTEQVVRGDAS
jgi:hypothetical protein